MREIHTIETERYEKLGDTGLLTHVGNITGEEAFRQLRAHLETLKMLPEEYFLPSIYDMEMERELPDYRTAICHTDWGGNEGIYLDVYLLTTKDGKPDFFHLATGKTLDSDGEAFLRMSRIAAECSILLNGRGAIVRVPDEPQFQSGSSFDQRLEQATARATDIPDKQEKRLTPINEI